MRKCKHLRWYWKGYGCGVLYSRRLCVKYRGIWRFENPMKHNEEFGRFPFKQIKRHFKQNGQNKRKHNGVSLKRPREDLVRCLLFPGVSLI